MFQKDKSEETLANQDGELSLRMIGIVAGLQLCICGTRECDESESPGEKDKLRDQKTEGGDDMEERIGNAGFSARAGARCQEARRMAEM